MLSLGWQEMVVIFLAALVLFGPKKLPELGRTIGKAITEFRRASNELKATFDREMQTIERENESLRETTQKYLDDVSGNSLASSSQAGTYEDSSYYDSAYYDSEAYRSLNDGSPSESTTTTADSTTATSSPVGEPATQGAESVVANEDSSATAVVAKPAEGAVARGSSETPAAGVAASPSLSAAEKA
jgi:TatA/E family protein of Tat protein translocase